MSATARICEPGLQEKSCAQRVNATIGALSPLRVVAGTAGATGNCAQCAVSALCLPDAMTPPERQAFATLLTPHKRMKSGQVLFHAGERAAHLYFVKAGSFKTLLLLNDGREQVTSFHFAGDVLGIDTLAAQQHPSTAIALEDATVCAVPIAQVAVLGRRMSGVNEHVQRLLAHEVVRAQALLLLLGRMHAEERVAVFLHTLSQRFSARGYSPYAFTLPMPREDIGSYLGLTLETVSRCFSRMKSTGVIAVDNRCIRVTDPEALLRLAGVSAPRHEISDVAT